MAFVEVEYGSGGDTSDNYIFEYKTGTWVSTWGSKTFNIKKTGTLKLIIYGYARSVDAKKNGAAMTPTHSKDATSEYMHCKFFVVPVSEGDSITVTASSGGNTTLIYIGVIE